MDLSEARQRQSARHFSLVLFLAPVNSLLPVLFHPELRVECAHDIFLLSSQVQAGTRERRRQKGQLPPARPSDEDHHGSVPGAGRALSHDRPVPGRLSRGVTWRVCPSPHLSSREGDCGHSPRTGSVAGWQAGGWAVCPGPPAGRVLGAGGERRGGVGWGPPPRLLEDLGLSFG